MPGSGRCKSSSSPSNTSMAGRLQPMLLSSMAGAPVRSCSVNKPSAPRLNNCNSRLSGVDQQVLTQACQLPIPGEFGAPVVGLGGR